MIKKIINSITMFVNKIMHQEVLFYFVLTVLMLPNVLLSITESATPIERVCSLIFPLGCYYLIATISKRIGWTIWMLFPISVLAGFQVVLLYIYGRSVIATDMFLNFVTTDANESKELLGNLLMIIITVVVLYITPAIFALVSLIKKHQLGDSFMRKNRNIAVSIMIVGISLLGVCYASNDSFSIKKQVYPINAYYNMYKAVSRYVKLKNYTSTSSEFKYNASSSHSAQQREIYVIVIGETSRAHNWELCGYNRPTNPKLKKVDDLIVFDSVLTEANITHKSVPMLISAASAKDYDIIYDQKSAITAFKEAGFKTAFFSTQAHTQTLTDYFGEEADVCEYLRDRSTKIDFNPMDMELVECMKNTIKEGAKKQLVVLHSYGSHFNYVSRYTNEFAYFTPDMPITPDKKCLTQLVNSYDNTIRYTDSFLCEIISELNSVKDAHTSLMYVSDHGEDLFDKGGDVIFHSSTTPSYYQLHVPMLVWMSGDYQNSYPQVVSSLKNNIRAQISSSASFFHTVLNIAGIETIYRDDTYSLASKSFIERPRVYLNDHYEGVPLLHVEMRERDFVMLEKF